MGKSIPAAAWAAAVLTVSFASAQLPEPRLTVMEPPGGMRGGSVEVTVAGGDLDGLSGMTFSHPGITAKPVAEDPPKLLVTIAADVPPGLHEAAVVTPLGVSNARMFVVGRGPELRKTAAIDAADKALALPAEATVNARTEADQGDHYAITCAADKRVRAEVWAQRIDSLLTPVITVFGPDGEEIETIDDSIAGDPAVDFTPTKAGRHVIRVHDKFAGGGPGYVYRLGISTGPVVLGVFPPVVKPGGTASFTLVGRDLGPAAVPMPEAADIGLQQMPVQASPGEIAFDEAVVPAWRILSPWDTAADLVRLRGGLFDAAANQPLALAVDLPVIEEAEPNDDPASPQAIERPAAIAGRFHPRGDRDWFTFDAKAGEEIVFDLYSRRLGGATDAAILVQQVVKAADGKPQFKEVAYADDAPGAFAGEAALSRPSLDPMLTFKAPADGSYRVLVREQSVDSVAHVTTAYVLQVRPTRPDFRLLAIVARPSAQQDKLDIDSRKLVSSTSLPAGGTALIDVVILRRDGFAGEVTISAEDLPPGVTAPAITIPAAAQRGVVVLQAADDAQPAVKAVRLVGRATIGGTEIVRAATATTLQRSYGPPADPRSFHAPLRVSGVINVAVTSAVAPMTVRPKEPGKSWETSRGGTLSVPIDVVQRPTAKGAVSLAPLVHPNSPNTKLPVELKVTELKIAEFKPAAAAAPPSPPAPPTAPAPAAGQAPPQPAPPATPEASPVPPPVPLVSATAVTIELAPTLAPGTYSVALGGTVKMSFTPSPVPAAKARAEAKNAADTVKELMTKRDAAKQALAAAEAKAVGGQADFVAARDAAKAAAVAADEAFIRADKEQKRLDKVATDREKAAAVKDIDVPVILPPITVVVRESPAEPKLDRAEIAVQAGGTADLAVALERKFGFTGPVSLEAAAATPVAGLSVKPVTVAADAATGTLQVVTAPTTPPGTFTLAVKGKMPFAGKDVTFERRLAVVVSPKPKEPAKP